jgi:glycosyltransferase involved in cell wall biosynthesis
VYPAFERGSVIYPPIVVRRIKEGICKPKSIASRFIVTVGAIGRRKNQQASIRAYARTDLLSRGVHYVLCGSREADSGDIIELAKNTPGVILLDYVTDGELAWLYRNAVGFVLVSELEGFGMPVAEAMSVGLPVLVSSGTALQEVAGENALSVDYTSEEEIANGMIRLIELDSQDRQRISEENVRRIKAFSLQKFTELWRETLVLS